MNISEKAKKIKMFLMDVDGVLTDGKIIYTSSGEEIKAFYVQDGLGISLLNKAGILTGIITGRNSSILERRAKELDINEVFQGKKKKFNIYTAIKEKYNLKDEEFLFIGDDIIDLPILNVVGFPVTVPNSPDVIKQRCIYITKRKGGEGAVREVIDYLLTLRGEYEKIIEKFLKS